MKTLKDLVQGGGCSIPWLHVDINLQNNMVKPCCKYENVVGTPDNFASVWRNEQYQQLRMDQQTGNTHSACQACAVPESAFSYKKFKNRAYQGFLNSTLLEPVESPQVYNITLKNTCNLACRMCVPGSSSKLAEVSRRSQYLTGFYYSRAINNRFDITSLQGNFGNVRHLTISGGEPLIDQDTIKLIKMVKAESACLQKIVFSTNMTQLNQALIDALAELGVTVAFNTSIDGPRHIHEYIRYGCCWEDIERNLQYLKSNYNFVYGINSTISALNVGYLPELVNEIEDLGKRCGINFTHLMSTPVLENHLHAGALPVHVKEIYAQKLATYAVKSKLAGVAELIHAGQELLKKELPEKLFREFTKEFDTVAETNIGSVYPELVL